MSRKSVVMFVSVVAMLAIAIPSLAQLGGALGRLKQAKAAYDDFTFTDEEEHTLGQEISAKLRDKYGVVQDPAVHKYVSLVGKLMAQESSRASLRWTFIVLDTDGVNAFAAPGGFVHITKGALALIDSEAELADVLGHEIGHITEKHTIKAIQKAKGTQVGAAAASRNEFLQGLVQVGYESVLENGFDRGDETAADRVGITLANKVGYAPQGMAGFLTRLADRNKDLKERSGAFASHPETKARLDALTRVISSGKLTSAAMVVARFDASIPFTPVPVSAVSQGPAPASSASNSGGGRSGLSNLNPLGRERSGNQTVSSAGSRGVNPDRDARGGPNKGAVTVTVTAAEISAFRKGIAG